MVAKTPRYVALSTAAFISASLLVLTVAVDLIFHGQFFPGKTSIITAVAFISSYLIVAWAIEKFIYEKIKIIYKTIHKLKRSSEKEIMIPMNEDVLEEVKKEVRTWGDEKIDEIASLRATDSFRKEFVGNVAHELKTPVFSIQGYILTLLEGALEDPVNNRKFLEKANASVERMVALLDDLDAITRIESRSSELEKNPFNLVELVEDVIDMLEHQAASRNILVKIKAGADRRIMVLGERHRIEQVLTNLIVNSINYGKENGETIIRFYDMEENILVEVADNGIGITAAELPRIFERFYRVDKSRSRNQGGSGLGLAIVKHIVEAHDQTINVRSTKGVGSTFSFTLEKV